MTTTPAPVPLLDINAQNAPLLGEIDAALQEISRSGAFIQGPACTELETAIAEYCGTKHAIGCASGSDALLLPLMALGIGPGDEVIVPSFTFFATAGAVWRVGASPVFADIDPVTFNIDPADVARKISPCTKAIMPVHLFGQSADMAALGEVAEAHELPIIEDAAQAIGASFAGKPVGSLGLVGAFSFYPTKNLGCFGDGGMMTTNDDELAEQLRRLRNHGQHPRYYHHVVGTNSRLDAMQAAVLNAKLPHLDGWSAKRSEHAERYNRELGEQVNDTAMVAPQVAESSKTVWNQYTIRVKNGQRDALQQHLSERKIGSAVYYPVPLHMQPCFASLGYQEGDFPHTEQAVKEVLSLPVFAELTDEQQTRVIEAIVDFAGSEQHTLSGPAKLVDFGASGANTDLPSRRAG